MLNILRKRENLLCFSASLIFSLSPYAKAETSGDNFLNNALTAEASYAPETNGESCENAYQYSIGNTISSQFNEGQKKVFFEFQATGSKMLLEFMNKSTALFPDIEFVKLYAIEEDCSSAVLKLNKSVSLLENNTSGKLIQLTLEDLNPEGNYVMLVKRNTEGDLPAADFKMQLNGFAPIACPGTSDPCNLIKNGGFEDVNTTSLSNGANFFFNEVCEWDQLHYDPDLDIVSGDASAIILSSQRATDTYGISEAIKQDISFNQNKTYILSFDISSDTKYGFPFPEEFHASLFHAVNHPQAGQNFKTSPFQENIITITNPTSNTYYASFSPQSNASHTMIGFYSFSDTFGAVNYNNYEHKAVALDDVNVVEYALSMNSSLSGCKVNRTIGPDCIIPGAVYSWSPSAGLSNANIANPTASPSSTTVYTLTVTHPQTTIALTASVTVEPLTSGGPAYEIPDGANVNWIDNSTIPHTGTAGTTVTISNQSIFVDGDFIVDANLILEDCDLYMGENAKITVDGAHMQVTNADNLLNEIKSCDPDKFWDGIYVDGNVSGSRLTFDGAFGYDLVNKYIQVENMKNGIHLDNNPQVNISETIFDRNHICLNVEEQGTLRPTLDITLGAINMKCTSPLIDQNGTSYYPDYSMKFKNYINTSSTTDYFSIGDLSRIDGEAGGVFIENSDVNLYYTVFEDFNNYVSTGLPQRQDIAVEISNVVNPTTPSSVFLGLDYFFKCKNGLVSNGTVELGTYNNHVNTDGFGTVYPWNANSAYAEISNNTSAVSIDKATVFNVTLGVKTESVPNLTVSNSDFDMETQTGSSYTNKQNKESYAIITRNLANTSTLGSVLIEYNTITHAKTGILAWYTSATIANNTILDMNDNTAASGTCWPFGPCPPVPAYGIKVATTNDGYSLERNKVANDVSNYTTNPSTNSNVIGISVEQTTNANNNTVVICNKVDGTGMGLRFSGNNGTNTQIEKNSMQNHKYAFVLANAGVIGDVGSNSIASDNMWNSGITTDLYAENAPLGSNVTFYVRSGSPYEPATTGVSGSGTIMNINASASRAANGNACTTRTRMAGEGIDDESIQAQSDLQLYPNPTSDFINLEFEVGEGDDVRFELYDLLGKKCKTEQLQSGIQHLLDLQILESGIYVYRLYHGADTIESGKLIIE